MLVAATSRLSLSSRSFSKSNESLHSTNSSRYSLMKSLSLSLNRGTELLKQTVQKAIFSRMHSMESQPAPEGAVAPTEDHKHPSVDGKASEDSLSLEMCYLRPIRSYPVTPRRRFQSAEVKTPQPRKMDLSSSSSTKTPTTKVKLQKGGLVSAFCSTKAFIPEPVTKNTTNKKGKVKAVGGKSKPAAKKGVKASSNSKDKSNAPSRYRKSTTLKKPATTKKTNGVVDKERLAQERRDFEFAKKLQQQLIDSALNGQKPELNGMRKRTRSQQVNGQESSNYESSCSYSLRNKRRKVEVPEPEAKLPVKKNGFLEPAPRRTTRRRI